MEHLATNHLRDQVEEAIATAITANVRPDHVVAVTVDVLADLLSQSVVPGSVETVTGVMAETLRQRVVHHLSREEARR